MVLEVGKRLLGPILQFSVVAPFGITVEEGDRAFVSADLHRIVFAPEIGWRGGVQLVDLFLRRAVGRRRQGGLNVAARNKSFQLSAGLGVVLYHLVGKLLFVPVTLLQSDVRRRNLGHVADSGFRHKILRFRSYAERRID